MPRRRQGRRAHSRAFVEDQAEWRGTEIRFDLCETETGTEVRFTHVGLFREHECFDVCANAWGGYIGSSLKKLILTGAGTPNADNVAAEIKTPHLTGS